MLKDNEPLLFIDTITKVNESKKNQKIYDSRKKERESLIKNIIPPSKNNEKKVFEDEKFQFLESRKLGNIIEMYKKGRPVLCSIITHNNEVIGIPSKRINNILVVNVSETEEEQIDLNDVQEINIIKF